MLRFPIVSCSTRHLRGKKIGIRLDDLVDYTLSVICDGNLRNWNCDFFFKQVRSCEVGRMMILRNKREEEAVTLYNFDQSRG